jgi:hypothetical protein
VKSWFDILALLGCDWGKAVNVPFERLVNFRFDGDGIVTGDVETSIEGRFESRRAEPNRVTIGRGVNAIAEIRFRPSTRRFVGFGKVQSTTIYFERSRRSLMTIKDGEKTEQQEYLDFRPS